MDAGIQSRPGEARDAHAYPWKRAVPAITVAMIAVVMRRPDAFLNPQFWAEDGSIFFGQASGMGWRALIQPHVGYHLLADRIWAGAWIGMGVPVLWLPTIFLIGAVLAWVAVAAFLFSPRLRLRLPEAMLAAMVLVPTANEVWFNLTDIQWPLALLWALWWLADDPRTRWGIAAESVAMAVVGLTGVFAVAASPLMAWRAWKRRSVASIVAAAICIVSAGIQWFTAHGGPTTDTVPSAHSVSGVAAAVMMLGKRVWGWLFLPPGFGGTVAVWVGVATGAAMLGTCVFAAWRSEKWRPMLGWIVYGGALLAAVIIRFRFDYRPLLGAGGGVRYFYVPQMLVAWALIQVVARSTRAWRVAAVVLLLCAAATAIMRFRLPELRDNDWPSWAARIEAGGDVGWVPIAPDGMRFYYRSPAKGR